MSPEQYYCMLLFLDTQTPVLCVGNLLCGYGPIWSVSCSLLHENVCGLFGVKTTRLIWILHAVI